MHLQTMQGVNKISQKLQSVGDVSLKNKVKLNNSKKEVMIISVEKNTSLDEESIEQLEETEKQWTDVNKRIEKANKFTEAYA